MKFDSSFHELVDIGDKAHQPKSFVFPKRKFGIKDRCFHVIGLRNGHGSIITIRPTILLARRQSKKK